MEKIRIIVDTASDITPTEAQNLGICLLPVGIQHEGKSYKEGYEMSKQEFWKLLEQSDTIPTTFQISPEQLSEAYETALADGIDHVIVVTINSAGSGMYQNAHLSEELFKEKHGADALKITIIDSHAYTSLYGRPVMQAAELLQQGESAETVIAFLKDKLSRVYGYAPIYTLKFAKKSGRISGVAAFVGEVLGFKPILYIGEGKVETLEKVRGETQMLPKAIELVKKDAVDLSNEEVMVLFGDIAPDEKERILNTVKGELNPKSIFVGDIGCSVSNNAGPLVYAIAFYGKDNGLYR